MTAGAAEIADAALDPAADATVEALALCFALVASCYIIPALAARCSLTLATSQLVPAHCPRPVVPAHALPDSCSCLCWLLNLCTLVIAHSSLIVTSRLMSPDMAARCVCTLFAVVAALRY